MPFNEFVSNVRRVDETSLLGALVLALVMLAFQLQQAANNREKLKGIPTVGSSGFVASWKDAFGFLFHSKEIIEKGYRKYHGSVFKVHLLDKWMIVVSGVEKINDIRKSSPGQLSSLDATSDLLQMDYTIGRDVHLFCRCSDEIQEAFNDNIPMTEDWIDVLIYERILQIVCRASNRMFVGLPLCRTCIELNINFTVNVFACAHIINLFPSFLKPVAGFILTPRRRALAKAEKFLGQTIRERLQEEDIHGNDWPGKPNDLLSWLLDATKGNKERRDVQDLITRILLLNLGAIHTTSMVFKTVPSQKKAGLKPAVGKMGRLDSFLKEAQRLYGDLGVFSVRRTARKDFIFSDGTVVPAGSQIAVTALSTHLDEENYEDPLQFKPWRFSEKRKQEGEGNHQQMVIPSLDYLLFGIGRSACPGRFFAVNMLKTLTAHVLLNFDVKIDRIDQFFTHQTSNQRRDVFFRKRAGVP
ncbi:cytochrome P450 [Armillaria borealis]|uniref:Cytochrome P450 n=1 Tax=Armillaria borealis TaxID=47425 RepID=A0AA39IYV7_9AGAR|nr:cytochrome P450 [Armillaria borealis]